MSSSETSCLCGAVNIIIFVGCGEVLCIDCKIKLF